MVFSPARSGRDNSMKHSHSNVLEVKEVVINVVNHKMVEQMSLSSTAYAKGINEFEKAGFTQVKSEIVQPPRVAESPVAFECVVNDVISLGDNPGAGNLVICEVKLIHIDENYLDADGKLDTKQLDLVARMGANWYCRASGDALFQINKPLGKIGIGFDQLPEFILHSKVLSGNELAKLASLEKVPTQEEVLRYREQHAEKQAKNIDKEKIAQQLIKEDKVDEAFMLLLS